MKPFILLQLGHLNESVQDCSAALKLDDKYIKPLLRRAKCYLDLEQFDEAVRDYEKAYKLERTSGIPLIHVIIIFYHEPRENNIFREEILLIWSVPGAEL